VTICGGPAVLARACADLRTIRRVKVGLRGAGPRILTRRDSPMAFLSRLSGTECPSACRGTPLRLRDGVDPGGSDALGLVPRLT
jgi:hypothetical protein